MARFLVCQHDQPIVWMLPIAQSEFDALDQTIEACPIYYTDQRQFWPKPAKGFHVFECSEVPL